MASGGCPDGTADVSCALVASADHGVLVVAADSASSAPLEPLAAMVVTVATLGGERISLQINAQWTFRDLVDATASALGRDSSCLRLVAGADALPCSGDCVSTAGAVDGWQLTAVAQSHFAFGRWDTERSVVERGRFSKSDAWGHSTAIGSAPHSTGQQRWVVRNVTGHFGRIGVCQEAMPVSEPPSRWRVAAVWYEADGEVWHIEQQAELEKVSTGLPSLIEPGDELEIILTCSEDERTVTFRAPSKADVDISVVQLPTGTAWHLFISLANLRTWEVVDW